MDSLHLVLLEILKSEDFAQFEKTPPDLLKLLHYFKYDRKAMLEQYMDNPDGYDVLAGLVPKHIEALPETAEWTDQLITFDEYSREQFYYPCCNHYFLRSDWQ